MGYFSYICQHCNEPINGGEGVKLWLLQNGNVLEEMEGNYDNYGGVDGQKDWTNDWNKIIDLQFCSNSNDGLAAIHTECWENSNKSIPTKKSLDDPDQGSNKAVKKTAPMSSSMFYYLISEKSIKENNQKLIDLNDGLDKLLKGTKEILEELKRINLEKTNNIHDN